MSSAPKFRGLDKRILYGLIAVVVVMLLFCGGVGFYHIVKNLNLFGSSGTVVSTTRAKGRPTFREDAVLKPMDAANGFLGAVGDEEYGRALKQFSTIGFQGRHSSASLRELVEREGRGLIGWTDKPGLASVSQTQDSKTFRGEVAGGPHGPARFEVSVSNESEGWRVSEFIVIKK